MTADELIATWPSNDVGRLTVIIELGSDTAGEDRQLIGLLCDPRKPLDESEITPGRNLFCEKIDRQRSGRRSISERGSKIGT
jgi:hypothetical protein